eukprot:TRINITY_DN1616_c0_g1_i7.p1 TRINITY_DN1616_c0_g1~~TRINITY_DN1616_c0_g1_i7.p1  ORF type:complete len:447 (-),score=87.16 TRINITY_DN1616_c0_g1_i7:54-1394(-)
MPVATFSGNPKGWGYNPCAPYAVHPSFGGYKALKRFVKAANSHSMMVLLDVIWNHASSDNILSTYDGYKGSSNSGIYFFEDSRASTPWGPRWNYEDPSVSSYILDNTRMWIEEYHISGFRWDSTVCIRKGGDGKVCWESSDNIASGWKLMQNANVLSAREGNLFLAAEDSQDFFDITKPVDDSNAGIPGAPGGAGFTSQWGYPFYYAFTISGLLQSDNGHVDANEMGLAISNTNNVGGDLRRLMFTENHDVASNQNRGRIPSIVNPGGSPYQPSYWAAKKAMLGIGVLLTAPLYPLLFYGQEMLTYNTFTFPVPPSLDWNLARVNLGLVNEVTDLISLRLNKEGTTPGLTGNATSILMVSNDPSNKVIVYLRGNVVVIVNMFAVAYSNYVLKNVPSDGTWYVRFNGDLKIYSPLFDDFGGDQKFILVSGGMGSVKIPKYSLLILSQ